MGVLEDISNVNVASADMERRVLEWICLVQSVHAGETMSS